MASVASLTSGQSGTDASSYASASITPTASRLWVASVASRITTNVSITVPTATGAGLTWTQHESSQVPDGVTRWRVTSFLGSGTPSSGAVTFDFAGQTQLEGLWSIYEVNDSPLASLIQDASNTGDSTTPNATLAAFSNPSNATFFACTTDSVIGPTTVTTTEADSYTFIHDLTIGGTNLVTGWKNSNDTSVGPVTLNISAPWAIAAAEYGSVVSASRHSRLPVLGVG